MTNKNKILNGDAMNNINKTIRNYDYCIIYKKVIHLYNLI